MSGKMFTKLYIIKHLFSTLTYKILQPGKNLLRFLRETFENKKSGSFALTNVWTSGNVSPLVCFIAFILGES